MFDFLKKQRLISASGLGIFRILFFSVQLFELLQIFQFKELIFDNVPFLEPYLPNHDVFLLGWFICLLFIIFGYKTRYALVANYAFTLMYLSVTSNFEYHMDYAYTMMNFVSMFLPLSLGFSVDALLDDRKEVPQVNFFNHYMVVFLAVALIYFDSIFHKLAQESWRQGLGLWLPASLPQLTWLDLSFLLDQEFIVKSMGYFSLLFEATLIFTMWFRSLGLYLAIIGIVFHVGIFLAFPIPFFAFSYCVFYLLILPDAWFAKLDKYFLAFKNKFFVSSSNSADQFLGLKPVTAVNFMIVITILQLNSTLIAPSIRPFVPENIVQLSSKFKKVFTRPFLGLTDHGVFLDWHYDMTKNLTIIKHNGEVLPLIKENGQVGAYNRGRIWANSSFRYLNMSKGGFYRRGLKKYTAFWAFKNGKDLRNLDFELYTKQIDVVKRWEKGFLKKQMQKPLRKIADIHWRNYRFELVPVRG